MTAATTRSACWTRWRVWNFLPSSTSGRPFPSAERPRQSLRPILRASVGSVYRDGVQDGYPFIFQGRDNGVVYWGRLCQESESLGWRVRRRHQELQPQLKNEPVW